MESVYIYRTWMVYPSYSVLLVKRGYIVAALYTGMHSAESLRFLFTLMDLECSLVRMVNGGLIHLTVRTATSTLAIRFVSQRLIALCHLSGGC